LERERRRAETARNIAAEANQLRREELARIATLRAHELDFLLTLTPEDFEGIVAKMYRQMGFSVQQTPMSNDFGRDLILQRGGRTTFVECKRYAKDKPIGRPALQRFYAAIMTLKADSGIVVTTSRFTATAIEFARENHIQLIDGQQLASLMARAFPSGPDANQYRVMCRECRDIVTFDLRGSGQESKCRNGHLVKKDI
jgi:restriction system protein